ncbi:MAG: AmmeMemoRadiSam system protein B, partial [Pirellulaceae bacterium]
MPNGIRMPAVAGILYPRSAHELRREVTRLLQQSSCGRDSTEIPKALIVPHAGLEYSGAVAAAAYARVRHARETIERVVLVGPAHDTCVPGLAVSEVGAFATPLGLVAVHRDSVIELLHLPEVHVSGFAHAREHSLEVQLPFLQVMLAEFTIVPVVVTDADPVTVASALDRTWGGP